jgi:hypothetical protein
LVWLAAIPAPDGALIVFVFIAAIDQVAAIAVRFGAAPLA